MSTLISGGCKNGKSWTAQRIAQSCGAPLYYIATMIPHDGEDLARIRRHQSERDGWGFETIECGCDILRCLDGVNLRGTFLLDSVTALLSNEMFPGGEIDPDAAHRVAEGLCSFAELAPNTIFVSESIGSDAALYDAWTEIYRRGLAYIERELAKVCDCVIESVCGLNICYKGTPPCEYYKPF